MKKIVLLITIQILCMHSFVVNAQRIFSTSYTMDDGLAANRVYSILQDSCGFMWFGTDDGLSRFDGIAFKNYYLSEYINATTITVIVGKKPATKPKLKQLQVKVKGYKYYPDSGKTIYTTRFTNKSKSTITKVKLKFTMTINEEMTRIKTFKVNIKPGKTKTMKLNIGKLIADPSNIKVKCLKFWYKS